MIERKIRRSSRSLRSVKIKPPVVVKKEKLTDNEDESKYETFGKSDNKSVKKMKREWSSQEEDNDDSDREKKSDRRRKSDKKYIRKDKKKSSSDNSGDDASDTRKKIKMV